MNVKPVNIFFDFNFNDSFANKVFFIATFGLTYFEAKVEQVYAIFIQPRKCLRFWNGNPVSFHGQSELLKRMQKIFLDVTVACDSMEYIFVALLLNRYAHRAYVVTAEPVLAIFK